MFQKLYLLLILLSGTYATALAQINSADVTQLHNVAKYTGSQEDLLKLFGTNVRFPPIVYGAKKVGTVVGVLKITKTGEIVEVGTINKAQPEFKGEFERVAQMTKGKWAGTNDTAQFFYVIIPIQFRVVGVGYTLNSDLKPAYFQETIVITASGVPRDKIDAVEIQAGEVYQRMENSLVEQVNTFVQEQNYIEAIKAMEELVNLQPLHTAYYQPLIALNERIGNKQEASYYREVVRLFSK